jgi:hypothetical protein
VVVCVLSVAIRFVFVIVIRQVSQMGHIVGDIAGVGPGIIVVVVREVSQAGHVVGDVDGVVVVIVVRTRVRIRVKRRV